MSTGDSEARKWTAPASKLAASMSSTKTQTLAAKHKTMEQKWQAKEDELGDAPPVKTAHVVKKVGFADVEAARKTKALAKKEKTQVHTMTPSVSHEEKMYDTI